ncbi:MAG: HD domain-containing protein [Actinomycetota bacterium]|nr:HD domain-containing protein [Actinomycetota bacterium]
MSFFEAGFNPGASAGLGLVLGVAAVAAGITVVEVGGRVQVSSTFIVVLLSATFLGPLYAGLAAVIAEVAAGRRVKTRLYAVAFNLLAAVLPAIVAANIVRGLLNGETRGGVSFYGIIGLAGVVQFGLNSLIAAAYIRGADGERTLNAATLKAYSPSFAVNLVLAVAGAGIYLKLGLIGITFALTAVVALTYMLNLVQRARSRSEQYVSLSWGVLAGLMRALDIRDERAARHAAAVAHFSQDIARAVGMSDVDCELAHTAGLLHDIGRFALSDRVAERGRTLTEEDWTAIQRHPELGAHMLRDLGMYGPVAEIVLAHHERIDGRGYPNGLAGDDIPEIARIIAVAEVYDTLTANDTYRTQMSSFEALNELRRVSGSQLDARYVEVLAELLAGVGVEYRHADTADFDSELDMERRIREAGAGG